jgi:hypothetical protein
MRNFVFFTQISLPHFCIVLEKFTNTIIQNYMKRYLPLFTFILLSTLLRAQGWERIISGGGADEARSIAKTADGGYITAGTYGAAKIGLIKTDADGKILWSKYYLGGNSAGALNSVLTLPDSNLLAVGLFKPNGLMNQSDAYIIKCNAAGNLLWQYSLGNNKDEVLNDVILMADGNYLAAGSKVQANGKEDAYLIKISTNGTLLWEKTFGLDTRSERFKSLVMADNGEVLLCGISKEGPDRDVYAMRIHADGNLIWENTFGFDFNPNAPSSDDGNAIALSASGACVIAGRSTSMSGQNSGLILEINPNGDATPIWIRTFPASYFNGLVAYPDGGYAVCGRKEISSVVEEMYLVHTDANGNTIWENTIGKVGPDEGYDLVIATDGGVVVAGVANPNNFSLGDFYFYLVKTTFEGVVYSNYIQGNVFNDFNGDCLKETGETPLKNWILKLEKPQFGSHYITSDAAGNYEFLVDTGTYTVKVYTPNDYWKACQDVFTSTFIQFYDTLILDLPIQAQFACPRNEVDIATPVLRSCTENTYTIRYCNSGTIPSLNTKVEIEIDPKLIVVNSSIPVFSIQDNKYRFNVGYLNNQDCGSFTITTFLDCNTIIGESNCVNAHIYPDTFCNPTPNWGGAIIEAKGKCENDTVKLSVKNRGSQSLNTLLEYIIVEDVVMRVGPGDPTATFNDLGAGEEALVWSIPANGKTYRIIAEQAPGYPGESFPTAAVEGCVSDTTSQPASIGYYTMFPEDDADAFKSSDCQETQANENIPSFIKRGHPKGFDTDFYIAPSTDLEYLIRFANTGADTIRQVIVRDTLSAWLDPATVYPGAGSHPYTFQVYAGGVVQFNLSNLNLLPSSNAADAASSGYIKFRVSQKPDSNCGRVILNRAAIYYDYNAPAFSNQTLHTICNLNEVIVVKTDDIYLVGADVKVFPNPFDESTTFEVLGTSAKVYSLELFDVLGRRVFNQFFNQSTFQLYARQLPTGLLFYRLAADGKSVASGKVEVGTH